MAPVKSPEVLQAEHDESRLKDVESLATTAHQLAQCANTAIPKIYERLNAIGENQAMLIGLTKAQDFDGLRKMLSDHADKEDQASITCKANLQGQIDDLKTERATWLGGSKVVWYLIAGVGMAAPFLLSLINLIHNWHNK